MWKSWLLKRIVLGIFPINKANGKKPLTVNKLVILLLWGRQMGQRNWFSLSNYYCLDHSSMKTANTQCEVLFKLYVNFNQRSLQALSRPRVYWYYFGNLFYLPHTFSQLIHDRIIIWSQSLLIGILNIKKLTRFPFIGVTAVNLLWHAFELVYNN